MSVQMVLAMAEKKGGKKRVELQASQTWINTAKKAAKSRGLGLSAYIRMLVLDDVAARSRCTGGHKEEQPESE